MVPVSTQPLVRASWCKEAGVCKREEKGAELPLQLTHSHEQNVHEGRSLRGPNYTC